MQWGLPLTALLMFAIFAASFDRNPVPLIVSDQQLQHAPHIPPEQQTYRTGEGQIKSDDQRNDTSGSRAGIEDVHSLHPKREGNGNPKESEDEASEYWSILGRRLKVTDTLLAVFTFALCVIGWWQGMQLRRTIHKMDDVAAGQNADMMASIREAGRAATAMEGVAEAMAKGAAATQATADAAKASADSAAKSVELIPTFERAYLSVTANYQPAINDKVICYLSFANHGKTPGILIDVSICTTKETLLPFTPNYSGARTFDVSIVFASGVGPFIATSFEIDKEDIIIFGLFRYSDIFRKTHTTWFAQFVHPDIGMAGIRTRIAGGSAYNRYD